VSLIAPVRRWAGRKTGIWRTVLPLYDGKECPQCGAVCVGTDSRKLHQKWHWKQIDDAHMLNEAIRTIGEHAGLRVVADDPDDGDFDSKVRRVLNNPEYDEENDDVADD
jgi:hypothetical protein